MDDLLDIIALYKDHYPLWANDSLKDIYAHIYPSLILNQFTVNRDDNGIYGFTNWAFLNSRNRTVFTGGYTELTLNKNLSKMK